MKEDLIITFGGEMPDCVNVNGEEYVRRSEVVPPPAPPRPSLELGDFVRVIVADKGGPRVDQFGCVMQLDNSRAAITFDGPFSSEHPCRDSGGVHAKHGRWFWVDRGACTDGTGARIEKI